MKGYELWRDHHRRRDFPASGRTSISRRSRRCWCPRLCALLGRISGDDRERLTETFRRTLASGDVVFSCGGIGNTPDDHTRQAVAAALGVVASRSARRASREARIRFMTT